MGGIMRFVVAILFINLFFISGCSVETISDEIVDGSTIEHEGKTYHVVQIGNQFWLKENLDVGTMINIEEEQTDNGIIEKYYLGNDPSWGNIYGGLYTWDEAMQYSRKRGAQGICPDSWHIPTREEYEDLLNTVNENANALKEIGEGTGNGAGTNTSGFSALLAGFVGRLRKKMKYSDSGFGTIILSSTEFYEPIVSSYEPLAWHLFLTQIDS